VTAKKPPANKKKPTGQPSSFKQETADAICLRLSAGESLRSICSDEGMPTKTTVFKWLADFPAFANQYARAREEQADFYAEQIVEIADEDCVTLKSGDGDDVEVAFDATAVARNRLRVDARKWYASKVAPKKYGDKITQEHVGADGGPIEFRDSSALKSMVRGAA
jgi:hypothetical protein